MGLQGLANAPTQEPVLQEGYLFGAVCPARGTGAAVAMPMDDTLAMQIHPDEISQSVVAGAHAVLLFDRAGWHICGTLAVPGNITLMLLPPQSPGLNPVETIWKYLLSDRVFDSYAQSSTPHATSGTGSSTNQEAGNDSRRRDLPERTPMSSVISPSQAMYSSRVLVDMPAG